jgi:hypothetical protein
VLRDPRKPGARVALTTAQNARLNVLLRMQLVELLDMTGEEIRLRKAREEFHRQRPTANHRGSPDDLDGLHHVNDLRTARSWRT